MENKFEDKRQAPRLRINYLMKYCKENSPARFHAFFNDVSEKGIRFLAKELIPEKTPILIELPCDSQPLTLNGKVVWHNELGSNFYELGVSFEGVSAQNKESLNHYMQGLREKLN